MNYNYSRHNIYGAGKLLQRALEVLPGFLSWTIILLMIVLSIIKPLIASVLMIAFILYWLLRLIYLNIFLILSYTKLAIEKNTDWMKRISLIGRHSERYTKGLISSPPHLNEIYQLVIIPVLKETIDIVKPGIDAIKLGKYPGERVLIVIALEERASDEVKNGVLQIKDEYANIFLDFLVIQHPDNIKGEARVKGANISYAAKQAKEYFDKKKISYENVIVSCFDADTVPNLDYFSCLTYQFMITPDRLRRSYQPIPVYHNNIWNVPSFARIIDIGTSFFELIEATNPSKMVTFSSHSMSFKALVDVGFWPIDMISDDSAIFWKAFIYYDGNYQTIPIYTTVSMDIVVGKNLLKTFVNIYKQKRRWAWGVENFPIVIRAFMSSKNISFYKKSAYAYKLLDGFVSWSTWSFLLAISWLPTFFASREFISSTVYYIVPRIQATIFSLASLILIVCMLVSILMLYAIYVKHNILKRIQHAFEWLFIPIIVLLLSALPAIDAQTRLMFGRYMEFWVTDKYRKNN